MVADMKTPLFLVLSSVTIKGYAVPSSSSVDNCASVSCPPGRTCLATPPGLVQCICTPSCPQHWNPVCGSDGISYDNHCLLHQAACNQEKHITPKHTGFCRGEREALLARREFLQQLSLWEEDIKIPLPVACYQNDRDRLREFLISWFQISAKKQLWYSPGMSPGEELWSHFNAISNYQQQGKNSKPGISPEKWGLYLREAGGGRMREKVRAESRRQLCLKELVEEGDKDHNHVLSFSEFRHLLEPSYEPSRKSCLLGSERREDGAETRTGCNGCVCACGKWVCTSDNCSDGGKIGEKMRGGAEEGGKGETEKRIGTRKYNANYRKGGKSEINIEYSTTERRSEMNIEYDTKEVDLLKEEEADEDVEDPEDDPDVQDIRWF